MYIIMTTVISVTILTFAVIGCGLQLRPQFLISGEAIALCGRAGITII